MDKEINIDKFTKAQKEFFTKKELKKLKKFYKKCIIECNYIFNDRLSKSKNSDKEKINIRNIIIHIFNSIENNEILDIDYLNENEYIEALKKL
jgi:hypothetical protein